MWPVMSGERRHQAVDERLTFRRVGHQSNMSRFTESRSPAGPQVQSKPFNVLS